MNLLPLWIYCGIIVAMVGGGLLWAAFHPDLPSQARPEPGHRRYPEPPPYAPDESLITIRFNTERHRNLRDRELRKDAVPV